LIAALAASRATVQSSAGGGAATSSASVQAASAGQAAEPEEEPDQAQPGSVLIIDVDGVVHGLAALSLGGSFAQPRLPSTYASRAAEVAVRGRAARHQQSQPQSSGQQGAGSRGDEAELLERARQSGLHARRRLQGYITHVPRTSAYHAVKSFFVILRSAYPLSVAGIVRGPYHQCAGYVRGASGRIAAEAVFQGFCFSGGGHRLLGRGSPR